MSGRTSFIFFLAIFGCVCGHEANATILSANSSAFSLSSDLVATDYNLVFSPIPTAAGFAPAPYDVTNSLDSFSQGTAGLVSVASGALSASASSNVDGTSGSKTTSASTYADGVSFELGGSAVLFSAGVVASRLSVQGDLGAINASGYADFSGASLSVFGTSYYFSTIPDPNTVMYDAGGLTIIANLQSITGDGVTSAGISITALDMKFDNFVENGEVVNGEVAFSHSEAFMSTSPAPEPASFAALGILAVGFRRRLRR